MRPPYAVAATSLLPLLSLGCALASAQLAPREPQRASGTRYPVPGKLILIMAIAGFLSGVSALAMENVEGVGAMFRVLATALAGVARLCVVHVLRAYSAGEHLLSVRGSHIAHIRARPRRK